VDVNNGLRAIKKQSNEWTDAELQHLRDNYPTGGVRACRDVIQRSASAISAKASSLGLSVSKKSFLQICRATERAKLKYWTPEEDAVMYELYERGGWRMVHAKLPSRNEASIKSRACSLNLSMNKEARYGAMVEAHKKMASAGSLWDGMPEMNVVNRALTMRWL
jgi:hypothetical protein